MHNAVIEFQTTNGVRVVPADFAASVTERVRGLAGKRVVERPMVFEENSFFVRYTMVDMLVPIDILAVDGADVIRDIMSSVPPGGDVTLQAPIRVRYVIEMPVGMASSLGLRVGGKVRVVKGGEQKS
jgi:uncharacterized membrane protein (UPF0127 family)